MGKIVRNEKPYDRCIDCPYLGVSCDGPNFLVMEIPRFIEWCQDRKAYLSEQDKKWTNEYIAEMTDGFISRGSVDRFFSGKIDDMKATTMRAILKVLIGSWGQYPCAMVSTKQEVVYVDSPELVSQCKQLQDENNALRMEGADYKRLQLEIEAIRQDSKEKTAHLLRQVEVYESQLSYMQKLLDERADFLRMKDDYIRQLISILGIKEPSADVKEVLSLLKYKEAKK